MYYHDTTRQADCVNIYVARFESSAVVIKISCWLGCGLSNRTLYGILSTAAGGITVPAASMSNSSLIAGMLAGDTRVVRLGFGCIVQVSRCMLSGFLDTKMTITMFVWPLLASNHHRASMWSCGKGSEYSTSIMRLGQAAPPVLVEHLNPASPSLLRLPGQLNRIALTAARDR